MTTKSSLRVNSVRYLEKNQPDLFEFWLGRGPMPSATVEAHCDLVYSFFLLGMTDDISISSVIEFCDYARSLPLPCYPSEQGSVSVHNCAYLFGALNLLSERYDEVFSRGVDASRLTLGRLLDTESFLPLFPKRWAHHSWRVSHWLGGIPSLLLSLQRSGLQLPEEFLGAAERAQDALSTLIDKETGLIHAYKSDFFQGVFRVAYGIRHHPKLGDLGGIAHILWVDHALGREYIAFQELLKSAEHQFISRSPFMEAVPYCLDFDIVQIVRTASQLAGSKSASSVERAATMMDDIEGFFDNIPPDYSLHKLPGALATYHECALLAGREIPWIESRAPIDIILHANWL